MLDQLDLALEQDIEELRRSTLVVDVGSGAMGLDAAVLDEPVQLFVGEALEEKAAAQLLFELVRLRGHNNSR